MPQRNHHKRILGFLTASALAHLLAFWLVHLLVPPDLQQRLYRSTRLPIRHFPIERFKARPAIALPQTTLDRLHTEGTPTAVGDATDVPQTAAPTVEAPMPDDHRPLLGAKPPVEIGRDTLDLEIFPASQPTQLPTVDPVLFDTERRRRTVAIIDSKSSKLKRAYLHLPAYSNAPSQCQKCPAYHQGREVDEIYKFITRGAALPERIPIETKIHWQRLGGCIGWPAPTLAGFDEPDPIHTFGCRPQRHILHYTEMKEYSLLLLSYIDVESTQALVRYLLEGGFAILDWDQLPLVRQALQDQVGERVESVTLELGHPLFHSYYDFTRYVPGNPICPYGIEPLRGLQLDGRLIALSGIGFITDHNCPGNKFYVNAIAYALIQPSPMGGRYSSRNKRSD
ncbi:MAG: hypothetical protein GKR89_04785 [Candidatus Latescibacteria bacterium]|nr:hypothetical protein [Candidatus Latescibacterota bacterium]